MRSDFVDNDRRHPMSVRPSQTTEDRIYGTIFDSVMSQRLAPGTKLPEVALCELFGATRAAVRKVLQRLAHDHIVELQPNRGARVAAPTPQETRQIFEARRHMEAAIARLAAENATKADIAALRAHLRQEHEALHHTAQPAWARLACAFHLQLAEVARNPILQRYLGELMSRCSLIVALYEPPGHAACEHDQHAEIVDCLARRDAEQAVRLMDAHLRELEQNVCVEAAEADDGLARMLGLAPEEGARPAKAVRAA
ncbi:GntR family transcriptional regulator [Aquabacterium soli]|uniref:GntR family transcriptional regulator n=2 Tax=Aquabacterium soli TaxID=2493092 RepID=A0A426VAJ3_9BURK|nr:GntR family transcriptional regulator [Aquabacterium soli]